MKKPSSIFSRKAFSLTEVMIAASITLVVVGLTLLVLLSMTKLYVRTDIKNSVSEDYRDLTRLLAEQGNQSNGFFIYKSFAAADRTNATQQIGPATDPKNASGDMVVFVYFSMQDILKNPNAMGVSRIAGFFREDPSNNKSPIRYFDSAKDNWGQTFSPASPAVLAIPAAGSGAAIESLLPPESFKSKCKIVALHTMGAAVDGATGGLSLFYNNTTTNNAPSFTVTGYILRSQASSGSGVAGYESQTAFNLTITPRSN